jgi:hypothetical protein
MRPRSLQLVAVALTLVGILATGCVEDREGVVHEYIVPPGTQARLEAGETVTVMPSELHLSVGDTLRIRNDDAVDQSVGPYVVMAGQALEVTYSEPGRFEGWCPLSEGQTYVIEISE